VRTRERLFFFQIQRTDLKIIARLAKGQNFVRRFTVVRAGLVLILFIVT